MRPRWIPSHAGTIEPYDDRRGAGSNHDPFRLGDGRVCSFGHGKRGLRSRAECPVVTHVMCGNMAFIVYCFLINGRCIRRATLKATSNASRNKTRSLVELSCLPHSHHCTIFLHSTMVKYVLRPESTRKIGTELHTGRKEDGRQDIIPGSPSSLRRARPSTPNPTLGRIVSPEPTSSPADTEKPTTRKPLVDREENVQNPVGVLRKPLPKTEKTLWQTLRDSGVGVIANSSNFDSECSTFESDFG